MPALRGSRQGRIKRFRQPPELLEGSLMLTSAAVTATLVLALSGSPAAAPAPVPAAVSAVSADASQAYLPLNFWCAFLRMCK
jgi:hypothetical protein